MHAYRCFTIALLLSINLANTPVHAQENSQEARPMLRFSCGFDPETPAYKAAETLYQEAFDKLGYDFEMYHRPSKRALADAEQGHSDGDCGRYEHLLLDTHSEHLIKVATPVIRVRIVFWTLQPELTELSPDQLLISPVRIGYMRGLVAFDRLLEQRPSNTNIQFNNLKQGFKMLQNNRIDVLMAHHALGVLALEQLKLVPTPLEFGDLVTHLGQPYLNIKHKTLAAPLAALLEQALQDPFHPLNILSD